MQETNIRRSESDSLDDIREYLEGRVFHVTRLDNLRSIKQSGELRANADGTLVSSFGFSRNGFFRKRKCVSVFDYRQTATETVKKFREHCLPFLPLKPNAGIAVLILELAAHDVLIPWTMSKGDSAAGEMVVPYVEAGYPEPLPLGLIAEIITIELTENPNSLSAIVRKAHER